MSLKEKSKAEANAPIVIFCYRRPYHLSKTLTSLMECVGFEQSPIIVYGDGPKTIDDKAAVEKTRAIAKTMLGVRAEYHFSDINLGLAKSIIAGVSEVVARFEKVIVIEDDLEVAPSFLIYMNSALNRFIGHTNVYQISGYMFNVKELKLFSDAFFLPLTVSWGWGTWKRAWTQFDPLATGWEELEVNYKMRYKFNLEGSYDFTTMLRKQMAGQLDSWAIRWYWSVFKVNGLTLFPPRTLVCNIGFDGSGSHGRGRLRNFTSPSGYFNSDGEINITKTLTVEQHTCRLVFRAIYKANGGWPGRLIDILRRLLFLFRRKKLNTLR